MPPIRFVDVVGTSYHGGYCCDCPLDGMDLDGGPDLFAAVRLVLPSGSWVGTHYVQLRADLVTEIPDGVRTVALSGEAFATRATGSATGGMGSIRSPLGLLCAHPEIELRDSDFANQWALVLDGHFIGFMTKSGKDNALPLQLLPQLRRLAALADDLGLAVGTTPAEWAYSALYAVRVTEEAA